MNTKNYESFSVRHGYEEPKPIQYESMDRDLRTGLWNALHRCFPNDFDRAQFPHEIYEIIWTNFLTKPVTEYDSEFIMFDGERIRLVEGQIFLLPWNEIYDLIEFVIVNTDPDDTSSRDDFINRCNQILGKENSAYKIVADLVTPITNEQEIQAIESAMATPYEGANNHINNALSLFSHRENPDYPNSIKESISAAESIVRIITGADSFAAGVNNLEEYGIKLHGAHQSALKSLYGFTSDADGIRHASTNSEPLDINQNTARFMLITCSAFVNYIISEKND